MTHRACAPRRGALAAPLLLALTPLALATLVRPAQAQGYAFATLNDPAATGGTVAAGVNAQGQVVGDYFNGTGRHGYVYTPGVGFFNFTGPDGPITTNAQWSTNVTGINSAGEVVGYDYNLSDDAARAWEFTYTPGSVAPSFTRLDDPAVAGSTGNTLALGINSQGQVAGDYIDSSHYGHGYGFTPGVGYANLEEPGANPTGATTPTGINDSGEVVGQFFDAQSSPHAFMATPGPGGDYAHGTFTQFDDPAAGIFGTWPGGLNSAGQIVGYDGTHGGGGRGFVYTPGAGFVHFEVPGAAPSATFAGGINVAGLVVGSYFDAKGVSHGFLATPAPEPSAFAGLALGTLGTLGLAGLRLKARRRA